MAPLFCTVAQQSIAFTSPCRNRKKLRQHWFQRYVFSDGWFSTTIIKESGEIIS